MYLCCARQSPCEHSAPPRHKRLSSGRRRRIFPRLLPCAYQVIKRNGVLDFPQINLCRIALAPPVELVRRIAIFLRSIRARFEFATFSASDMGILSRGRRLPKITLRLATSLTGGAIWVCEGIIPNLSFEGTGFGPPLSAPKILKIRNLERIAVGGRQFQQLAVEILASQLNLTQTPD